MNSVCIRRPAEFFRVIAGCAPARRVRAAATARGFPPAPPWAGLRGCRWRRRNSSSRTPSATVLGGNSSRISSRTASSTSVNARKSKSWPISSIRRGTQILIERLDEVADVGLVQLHDQRAQALRIVFGDGLRDLLDEVGADRPIRIAERAIRGCCGHVSRIGHAEPHGDRTSRFYARHFAMATKVSASGFKSSIEH